MKKNTMHFLKVGTASVAFFGITAVAFATGTWVAPTGTAPANNVAAPINVSSVAQVKPGMLDVTGFNNWGASFFSGAISAGSTWTGAGPVQLYVKNMNAGVPNSGAAVFAGAVGIRGSLGITQNDGSTSTTAPGFNTIYVQGQRVCLENGINCSSSTTGIFPITANPTASGQGAWIGWNWLTGTMGETDFINNRGGGIGGFAFVNTSPGDTGRTTLMSISSSGNMGIGGTPTADKLYLNGPSANNLLALQSGGSTQWRIGVQNSNGDNLQIGDGATMTPELSIAKVSGNTAIRGNLTVAGVNVCRQDGTNCPAGIPAVPSSGGPAVLFTTGNGIAIWKPVKVIRYGCNGPGYPSEIRDGRILVMDSAGTSPCNGLDLGAGQGVWGYAITTP